MRGTCTVVKSARLRDQDTGASMIEQILRVQYAATTEGGDDDVEDGWRFVLVHAHEHSGKGPPPASGTKKFWFFW